MFYNEHSPPHFHAEYQGQRGVFGFDGEMTKGNLKSKTAKRLIKEWALLHEDELHLNWKNAAQGKQINKLEPLN